MLASIQANCQFYYGIKGSYSIPFNKTQEIKYDDANDFFVYRVNFLDQTVSPTVSIIGYYRKDLVYFQSEIQYKSVKTRFRADNYIDLDNITNEDHTKVTRSIDIPISAGVRIDRFKLGVGPTFSVIIDENRIFQDTDFFVEQRANVEMGFGFHFGVLLYRLHLDIAYQYRFNQVGDYLYWRGVHKGFSQPVRYIDIGMAFMF